MSWLDKNDRIIHVYLIRRLIAGILFVLVVLLLSFRPRLLMFLAFWSYSFRGMPVSLFTHFPVSGSFCHFISYLMLFVCLFVLCVCLFVVSQPVHS